MCIRDSTNTKVNSSFEKIWRIVQTERLVGKKGESNLKKPIKKKNMLSDENQMLSEKYKPKHYFELIGDHKVNIDIISWLKAHKEKEFKTNPYFYFDEEMKKV